MRWDMEGFEATSVVIGDFCFRIRDKGRGSENGVSCWSFPL